MSNAAILDKLDRATDRAAAIAIDRGYPIRISKKSTLIGRLSIEKNTLSLYDIVSPDKVILFKDISIFDVAIILAQRHNDNDVSAIKKILALFDRYEKHHNDMLNYLHCLKGAKARHDIERMAILEDKFQMSETLARLSRDSISNFKRTK